MASDRGWIGVDLDGTLADYQGWRGIDNIGEPVPTMLLRVRRWLTAGKDVRIFTARVWPLCEIGENDDAMLHDLIQNQAGTRLAEAAQAALHIREWCQKHLGKILPVTCQKDFAMIQLWDDRCVQVELNTGKRADGLNDLI